MVHPLFFAPILTYFFPKTQIINGLLLNDPVSGAITIDSDQSVMLKVYSEGGELVGECLDKYYDLIFFVMRNLPTTFPATLNFNLGNQQPSRTLSWNAAGEAETAN